MKSCPSHLPFGTAYQPLWQYPLDQPSNGPVPVCILCILPGSLARCGFLLVDDCPQSFTPYDSVACLGKGTETPQGPVLGTALLVLVGL